MTFLLESYVLRGRRLRLAIVTAGETSYLNDGLGWGGATS